MKLFLIIVYFGLSVAGIMKAEEQNNEFFLALCTLGTVITVIYAMISWILYEINKTE